MFKSEEQINSRLNSGRNLVNRFGGGSSKGKATLDPTPVPTGTAQSIPDLSSNESIEPDIQITVLEQPGNKEGKLKLLSEQKTQIAIRSRLGEDQKSLADEFGVSQAAISSIERGKTKTDTQVVNSRLMEVEDRAMENLLAALGFIDTPKLEKLDAVKLSMVAMNMGKVVGTIRPKEESEARVSVHIYAPELKKETAYKTVDV